MATSANTTNDQEVVVSLETDEEAIERAMREDPDLNDIISKLDSAVTIEPDHDLNMDSDSYSSYNNYNNDNGDSDTVSTSSSYRDNDHDNNNGDSSSSTSASARNSPQVGKRNGASTIIITAPAATTTTTTTTTTSASSGPASVAMATTGTPTNGLGPSGDVTSSNNENSRESPKTSLSRHSPSKDSVKSDGKKSTSGSVKSSRGSSIRNPLKALKKLTKFAEKDDEQKKTRPGFNSEFTAVVVDKLPQVFVVKYMGHREVQGMFGLHHVRRPVDEMVKEVKASIEDKPQMELPLLYVVVSPKGLDLREHKRNKVKKGFPSGLMPIDFISYGVQDIKYWRVFTCIVVRELSSRSRSASCHAFLCDSSHSGRKMALALGAAFTLYSKKLKDTGKAHNFQVELRPPDELADAVDAECDA